MEISGMSRSRMGRESAMARPTGASESSVSSQWLIFPMSPCRSTIGSPSPRSSHRNSGCTSSVSLIAYLLWCGSPRPRDRSALTGAPEELHGRAQLDAHVLRHLGHRPRPVDLGARAPREHRSPKRRGVDAGKLRDGAAEVPNVVGIAPARHR